MVLIAVIKDVANLAGLSVSAVSKYLKNPDSVRPDTRQRIESAIEELNYVPSTEARALRTGLTGMISIISPNITNPFFAELFSVIQKSAAEKGYTSILQTISRIQESGNSVVSKPFVVSSISRVDGLIVCFPDDEEVISFVKQQWGNIPMVLLAWNSREAASANIVLDVEEGIYIATQHLLSMGHRRISYVGAPQSSTTSRKKQKGYVRAMTEQWLAVRPEFIYHGCYGTETGYEAARAFWHAKTRPTAIVTEADIFAIGCIKYCHRKGIDVPGEMAVTGFDDIPMAAMYQPPITTVRLPIEDMGRTAVRTLYDIIHGSTKAVRRDTRYEGELVIRRSTDSNYIETI
jgi:DNA-binding LacI/PurR family transcriptional regulator